MRHIAYHLKNWPARTIIDRIYRLKKGLSVRKNINFLLIACFPRSASNYLTSLLCELLKYERKPVSAHGGFYQDCIYLPSLIDAMLHNAIATHHMRLTLLNRPIIKELNIRPIVLVRNIFDVVVSYRDFILQRGIGPLDLDKADLAPELCPNFYHFDIDKQYDYIIDMIVAWYIGFYVTWYHYTINKKEIDAYWLRYEDLVSDPKKYLIEILAFHNLPVSKNQVDDIVHRGVKVNYNKGIVGRGNQLSSRQKKRIIKFVSYHDNISFDMIGL